LFSLVLLIINHKDTIQTVLLASGQGNETEIIIENPKINTPADSLNAGFGVIAETYNLPKSMSIPFIVDENGIIRNPSFENIDNPEASLKLSELIRSIEAEPGFVSGKAVSMGTGLTLVSR
jgi:hypothetical protein